jgi:hypothetical protein
MLHCVAWQILTDVSEMLTIRLHCSVPEDRHLHIFRNEYLRSNQISTLFSHRHNSDSLHCMACFWSSNCNVRFSVGELTASKYVSRSLKGIFEGTQRKEPTRLFLEPSSAGLVRRPSSTRNSWIEKFYKHANVIDLPSYANCMGRGCNGNGGYWEQGDDDISNLTRLGSWSVSPSLGL